MSIVDGITKNDKVYRRAKGMVNNRKVVVELSWKYEPPGWWVDATSNTKYNPSYHGFTRIAKFFANRYFNYLVKTHNLIEETL